MLFILPIRWSFYILTMFTFDGSLSKPDLLVHLSVVMKIDGREKKWYPFDETVFTMLWGTLGNNFCDLEYKAPIFVVFVNQYFIVRVIFIKKKHFNVTMPYSCALSYTLFSVLGAQKEIFPMNEKWGSKIYSRRSSYASLRRLRQNTRGATHTFLFTDVPILSNS